MGFMDKIKGLAKGKNAQMRAGIDKGEQLARGRLDDKYESKIATGAAKARDAVDRIDPKKDARP